MLPLSCGRQAEGLVCENAATPSAAPALQVLDARDPLGTRCKHLEQHLRKNAQHKHMLLLLNKCDLVGLLCELWVGTGPVSCAIPVVILAAHASMMCCNERGSGPPPAQPWLVMTKAIVRTIRPPRGSDEKHCGISLV